MASMSYRQLAKLLGKHHCRYIRDARRGGHEWWYSPITKRHFSVPKNLKGEGTLKKILKDSGVKPS